MAFMRPSGCIILHILSPQKHGVLLCRAASRAADVLRWQRVCSACFLFRGVVSPQTASVYQLPLGVRLEKKEERRSEEISSRLCLFYSLATSSASSGQEKEKKK